MPKIARPNYGEFYEKRWFVSGADVCVDVDHDCGSFPLRAGSIFRIGDAAFGIELCEDLWTPNPPSGELALADAEILLNWCNWC